MRLPHSGPAQATGSNNADIDERIPVHVAIIMDGNGRWAEARGQPRAAGHRAGAERVREIASACEDAGVRFLTLYAFSTENWRRPRDEVEGLFSLLVEVFTQRVGELLAGRRRVRVIGSREGLPASVVRAIEGAERLSEGHDGLTIVIAFNYGGRAELAAAARELARRVRRGLIQPDSIDEATVASCLQTAGIPDPDLVIRTAGEMRLSNFLLWQSAYAEFYSTAVLWPDFDRAEFQRALEEFARRQRRFGGVVAQKRERGDPQ